MNGLSSLTLRHLDYFVAVVEHESISEAAHEMHVSPGGVSASLTQLEQRLDTQLTLRTRGRGVSITPAGRRVYDIARGVRERLEEIETTAATLRGELTGTLRLGLFTTLSPWLFPGIAQHFSTHYPRVDLRLEEGASATLLSQLREGRLDAALLYENHLDGAVTAHRIAPVRLQLAAAPTHPLAEYEAVPLRALRDEDAVILSTRPATDHVEGILREAGMTPRVRWRSANVETIRSLVARGLGYSIIMGRPYGDITYEGMPIVYRPIADELPANSVVLATAEGARSTAKHDELLTYCRRAFGSPEEAEHALLEGPMGRLS